MKRCPACRRAYADDELGFCRVDGAAPETQKLDPLSLFAGVSLARAPDERTGSLAFFRVEPTFDPLREDPRFKELEARVG